jgi:hypothetical protein
VERVVKSHNFRMPCCCPWVTQNLALIALE